MGLRCAFLGQGWVYEVERDSHCGRPQSVGVLEFLLCIGPPVSNFRDCLVQETLSEARGRVLTRDSTATNISVLMILRVYATRTKIKGLQFRDNTNFLEIWGGILIKFQRHLAFEIFSQVGRRRDTGGVESSPGLHEMTSVKPLSVGCDRSRAQGSPIFPDSRLWHSLITTRTARRRDRKQAHAFGHECVDDKRRHLVFL